MSLFKRSVVAEITSHAGVVMSTLMVVWLSVLLVRLLGQAAEGTIGSDLVLGIAAFSSVTALPTILTVTLFIAVIVTVSRSYRENEMVVWFTSGISLITWLRPVLRVSLPICALIAILTVQVSPWAYAKIEEYRQRFEQRSDIFKIATGQFIETQGGNRVFFIEPDETQKSGLGDVFVRVNEGEGWISTLTSDHADYRVDEEGRRFIDLGPGTRYDMRNESTEFRMTRFESFTMQIKGAGAGSDDAIRQAVLARLKARPMLDLISDGQARSNGQIMWRISMPIAALNLALLAIPLGAVNPRMGRSINLIIAGLVALLYMNLLNLMRSWIADGTVGFVEGTVGLNLLATILCVYFFWRQIRVKKPKPPLSQSTIAAN
ncbi:MAG: LPS export ABC transporter permease LptF [Alcaligenaceae bacterium]|nr:LPS export ABC transporter permease LptF [Alcaligenaceae bacterium]